MMWYNKTQQYLRQSFTRSARGFMLLGKDNNNLVQAIEVDPNGSQQTTISDSSGNLVSVSSNQLAVTDSTGNTTLSAILNALTTASTAASVSTSSNYTLTSSLAQIGAIACKQVTLLNLSTNPNVTLVINGGSNITLEPGYSMTIPCTNLNQIQAKTATGGEVLNIIYSV